LNFSVQQLKTTSNQPFQFDSIDAALVDLKAGRALVVVDDENRENEGDLICAAQFATPDMINFMAVEARGLICLAMTGDRLDELDLPLMVSNTTDSNQTAFTVSIDASPALGVTLVFPRKTAPAPSKLQSTSATKLLICIVASYFSPPGKRRRCLENGRVIRSWC
jgi:3,4-dihydroxy 2-butanone 4-phosphate synthase/GTP cyclohydrolase II